MYEISRLGDEYDSRIVTLEDIPAEEQWDCLSKSKCVNWFEMMDEEVMNHVILENI
jgi:hypothetical protein